MGVHYCLVYLFTDTSALTFASKRIESTQVHIDHKASFSHGDGNMICIRMVALTQGLCTQNTAQVSRSLMHVRDPYTEPPFTKKKNVYRF
jgi:hypothetical protein